MNRLLRANLILAALVLILGLVVWIEPGLGPDQTLPPLTLWATRAAHWRAQL